MVAYPFCPTWAADENFQQQDTPPFSLPHQNTTFDNTSELIHLIFELPYCRIQNLVDAKIAERQAASRYLKQMVEIGVLEEKAVGREKLFLHPKLLRLLTRDDDAVEDYA